jgi:hypothetical protein
LCAEGGTVNERFGHGRRNWKKRWFVLSPIEFMSKTGYELQYYDSEKKKNLKGSVGLNGIEIFTDSISKHQKNHFEFQILLQNGNTFQLSCETEDEREQWIDSLHIIAIYMRKLSTSEGHLVGVDGYDPSAENNEEVYIKGEEFAQNCNVSMIVCTDLTDTG